MPRNNQNLLRTRTGDILICTKKKPTIFVLPFKSLLNRSCILLLPYRLPIFLSPYLAVASSITTVTTKSTVTLLTTTMVDDSKTRSSRNIAECRCRSPEKELASWGWGQCVEYT